MKTTAKDFVSIAQQFFTAYDAHEVDGMLALFADGVHIPHCYILRFDTDSKITRLNAYWDNTILNSIKASGV